MKKNLLLLLLSCFALQARAQQTELSFGAYRTLMHFSGDASVSTTSVSSRPINHVANPFGNRNGGSFGFSIRGQFVTKNNIIAGLEGGTDQVRSKVQVTNYTTSASWNTYYANGIVNHDKQFINANPYFGYRLNIGKVDLDLLAGLEIGFEVFSSVEGFINDEYGNRYKVEHRNDKKSDLRAKTGFALHYDRVFINASYARGFTDYTKIYEGIDKRGAYTNILRFGVGFKIF